MLQGGALRDRATECRSPKGRPAWQTLEFKTKPIQYEKVSVRITTPEHTGEPVRNAPNLRKRKLLAANCPAWLPRPLSASCPPLATAGTSHAPHASTSLPFRKSYTNAQLQGPKGPCVAEPEKAGPAYFVPVPSKLLKEGFFLFLCCQISTVRVKET